MPADLCLLEVHKHVVHRIGGPPQRAPEPNAFFLAPKVPSMQKRPQVGVSPINPNFFRKIPNHNQLVLPQKQAAQFQLAGRTFFLFSRNGRGGMTCCVTVFSSGPV